MTIALAKYGKEFLKLLRLLNFDTGSFFFNNFLLSMLVEHWSFILIVNLTWEFDNRFFFQVALIPYDEVSEILGIILGFKESHDLMLQILIERPLNQAVKLLLTV